MRKYDKERTRQEREKNKHKMRSHTLSFSVASLENVPKREQLG